jgi:chlorobactene glucosyltransferase
MMTTMTPGLLGLALSISAALVVFAWGVVCVYLVTVALTLYGLAQQKPLASSPAANLKGDDAPLVSILVPVRNEEQRVLRECLRSILAQDYGRFEVVAVNDRSTDASGAILKEMADGAARLRVIEGRELPAGWLGKPHAMQQALVAARGQWVLATDADMIFERTALSTAMSRALDEKADALTLIPQLESYTFWERVVIPTWAWVLLMVFLLYRVNSPRSPGALGFGCFFLVRRSALERVGGYEALKDEVAEDFRLAQMLKRTGARLRMEFAPQLLRTRMYANFREMWECHAKNWFAGANNSLPLAIASVLSVYIIGVVPPLIALGCAIAIAAGADVAELWRLLLPAALAWLLQVFVLVLFNRRFGVPLRYAWLSPLGLALLYAILLDSGLRITFGKGVTWKGRSVYEEAGGIRPPRPRRAQ